MPSTPSSKNEKRTVAQLLRPQTRADLILDVDLLNDRIDVRSASVMEVTDSVVILSQTNPPVLRSMIGRPLEVTFVSRDPLSLEIVRWGWAGQITDVISDYKLFGDGDKAEYIHAVKISLPASGQLNATNARMDYRIQAPSTDKVSIQTHPSFGRISLLDFSAGGVLIQVPAPPQGTMGMKLWFTIFFNDPTSQEQTVINGGAEVVRIMYNPGESTARIGLKFIDLDLTATRAMQKAINFHMLEEQRLRNRETL